MMMPRRHTILPFILILCIIFSLHSIYKDFYPNYSMEGEGYFTFMHCSASGYGHYVMLTEKDGSYYHYLLDHSTMYHGEWWERNLSGKYVRITEGRKGFKTWGEVEVLNNG